MTLPETDEKTPPVVYVFIIILPYLLFYWMMPFVSDLSIGQDYQQTPIQNQMELLFSIKTGTFPLYVPGYAMGNTASTLTLGQVFHPLAHIASVMPGYWDGKALEWNTFLRLFSLGLTQLALFMFLRKLKINTLFSFLLSCITVYNLRMLDLFRYGASLEAYTGFLILCAVIGWNYISPTRWTAPLSIIGLTYLLVCSGHTQMMYYALAGTCLFLLLIPFFISSMLEDRPFDFKGSLRFWMRMGLYIFLGILLSSAYILPFYFDFIASNVDRVGQSYAWADAYRDTFIGTLNNFFLPLRSDVHGVFGGSSLIIIAAMVPALRLFKIRVPYPVWIIWGVFLVCFLYIQGARTPIHYIAWKYVPFISSFRIAGRISLILPLFIMLLLAWVVKGESFQFSLRSFSLTITPVALLAIVGLIVMAIYFLIVSATILFSSSMMLDFAHFIPVTIRKIPRLVEIIVLLTGMASLAVLAFYEMRTNVSHAVAVMLCMIVLFQIGSVLKYGTWIADREDKPTYDQMISGKKANLEYAYSAGSGYYSSAVKAQVSRSFIEPYLGKFYTDITSVSSMDDAYNRMQQSRTPEHVFVEEYEPEAASSGSEQGPDNIQGSAELVYSSFNRLQFRISSSQPAFFGLSYPFTGHWSSWVNGRDVPVYRANGAAHAVQIQSGENLIEFRYWSSSAFWGMIVSCATFVLIGLFVCISGSRGLYRIISVVIVLILGAGSFSLWYHSLYSGDNLGTKYSWTYSPPADVPNLAYGKNTRVSQSLPESYLHLHSSRGVDGDRTPDSGFMTDRHANPSWTVDLHQAGEIMKIVLHESRNEEWLNRRPLLIDLSLDNRQWQTAASLTSPPDIIAPLHIDFEHPKTARYLRITSSGNCILSLDEVEVYGPEIPQ